MARLLTTQELAQLGRPIGKVDPLKLEAFISEVEHLYIKPTLGVELYLRLIKDEFKDDRVRILLNGGVYKDSKGCEQLLVGLKTTISYFVFAQNIMSGDFQSTRFGMVVKDGDYSSRISSKERSDFYNNTLEVANCYLKECVNYCKEVGLITVAHRPGVSFGGITIRKIGN